MNLEIFEEWLEDPTTEYFMKYLKDSIKEESELVTETIANNGVLSENEQIRIGMTCVTLDRISEIDFEEIDNFYKKGDEE